MLWLVPSFNQLDIRSLKISANKYIWWNKFSVQRLNVDYNVLLSTVDLIERYFLCNFFLNFWIQYFCFSLSSIKVYKTLAGRKVIFFHSCSTVTVRKILCSCIFSHLMRVSHLRSISSVAMVSLTAGCTVLFTADAPRAHRGSGRGGEDWTLAMESNDKRFKIMPTKY